MNVIIEVPAVSGEFEFVIENEKSISTIIAEISEIIAQKCKLDCDEKSKNSVLVFKSRKRILSPYQTPVQAGISNGDVLILV